MGGTKGTGARPGARTTAGLTLIELLITVVISAFFFAAMVPVFVMASEQGQTDRARVLATNAAQSTIEILRDLPYDQLYDTQWDDAHLAEIVDLTWKGDGSGIDVSVEPQPFGVDKGQERYLNVSVRAWWADGQRYVTLTTVVYRQGLGTHTLVLYAYPLQSGNIRQVPVIVVARMDGADKARTERIDFAVWASNGTVVDEWSVFTSTGTPGYDGSAPAEQKTDGYWYYSHSWSAEDLADGSYTFIATTRPIDPTPEDTTDPLPSADWARKTYTLDLHIPAEPTIVGCQAGYKLESPTGPLLPYVFLKWDQDLSDNDIGHVEIFRTGTAADGSALDSKNIVVDSKSATMYVDRDVVTGATYSYKVMIQDAQGQRGEWSDVSSRTVPPSTGLVAPTPPVGPTSTSVEGESVTVTWTAPTGNTGIEYYRVYRDPALSLPIADVSEQAEKTYPDPFVEYGKTYSYVITAVDEQNGVLVESLPLNLPAVMVPEPPKVGMRISVSVGSLPSGSPIPAYALVVVHSLGTGDFYPQDTWDYPRLKIGKRASAWETGNVFYPGPYEVIAMFYTNTGRCGTYKEPVVLDATMEIVNVVYTGPN